MYPTRASRAAPPSSRLLLRFLRWPRPGVGSTGRCAVQRRRQAAAPARLATPSLLATRPRADTKSFWRALPCDASREGFDFTATERSWATTCRRAEKFVAIIYEKCMPFGLIRISLSWTKQSFVLRFCTSLYLLIPSIVPPVPAPCMKADHKNFLSITCLCISGAV